MRFTVEQRLRNLEREIAILQDTVKMLHQLLKKHKELINDYIVHKITVADTKEQSNKNLHPAEEVYAFVCRERFDKIDKDVHKMRKLIESMGFKLRAG